MSAWTFRDLQAEQAPWVRHNFGERPAWHPLLGILEEIGELETAMLIVDDGFSDAEVLDAIADIVIFVSDFCTAEGVDLETVYRRSRSVPASLPLPELASAAGRICHAFLKREQGIRGTAEDHQLTIEANVAALLLHLERLVLPGWTNGSTLPEVVRPVWEKVRLRDFKKDPNKGGET